MKDYIRQRVIILSDYIIEHGATVRDAAKQFGVSKSTVHKDVTERLRSLNSRLYGEVQQVLENNKEERHIRGGIATRMKYQKQKQDV